MSRLKDFKFDRWTPVYERSLPFRVFKAYDDELFSYITSLERGCGYIYSHLKADGAVWESPAYDFGLNESDKKQTVKEWSDKSRKFKNWVRLSLLMSCCAYFENYIASIIKEVLESDPGLMIGFSHSVDGIKLLKYDKKLSKESIKTIIDNCTKGEWTSRLKNLNQLTKTIPEIINDSIGELEKMRKLRNDFGHAFGRDIELSQNYFVPTVSPIKSLSTERFNKFHYIIRNIVREMDISFMRNHIGNFEPLLQFHAIYPSVKDLNKDGQTEMLKDTLYRERKITHGTNKNFCRALIDYYINL